MIRISPETRIAFAFTFALSLAACQPASKPEPTPTTTPFPTETATPTIVIPTLAPSATLVPPTPTRKEITVTRPAESKPVFVTYRDQQIDLAKIPVEKMNKNAESVFSPDAKNPSPVNSPTVLGRHHTTILLKDQDVADFANHVQRTYQKKDVEVFPIYNFQVLQIGPVVTSPLTDYGVTRQVELLPVVVANKEGKIGKLEIRLDPASDQDHMVVINIRGIANKVFTLAAKKIKPEMVRPNMIVGITGGDDLEKFVQKNFVDRSQLTPNPDTFIQKYFSDPKSLTLQLPCAIVEQGIVLYPN